MKKTAHVLVLVLYSLVHQNALAQDDTPWWKRLFRKETVEEMEEKEAKPRVPDVIEAPMDTILSGEGNDDVAPTDSMAIPVLRKDREGEITLQLPKGMERLDSLFLEQPPELMGYRVQVYFGRLNDARDRRGDYLRSELEYSSYLIQNPPNFAVQLGDFRTELEAWRVLQELKELYPAAIVVPAEIEWPRLDLHAPVEEEIPERQ